MMTVISGRWGINILDGRRRSLGSRLGKRLLSHYVGDFMGMGQALQVSVLAGASTHWFHESRPWIGYNSANRRSGRTVRRV